MYHKQGSRYRIRKEVIAYYNIAGVGPVRLTRICASFREFVDDMHYSAAK